MNLNKFGEWLWGTRLGFALLMFIFTGLFSFGVLLLYSFLENNLTIQLINAGFLVAFISALFGYVIWKNDNA